MPDPETEDAGAPSEAPVEKPPTVHFRVASPGDGLGIVAGVVLLIGGALMMLAGSPDQALHTGMGVAALGGLLFLQSVSSATPLGKFMVAGGAAVGGAALAINLWFFEPQGLAIRPPTPELVTLLGALGSFLAADMLRREAGRTYTGLAKRTAELVQEPAFHRAALLFFIPWALVAFLILALLELGPQVAGKYAAIFIQYFFNPIGKEVAILCGIQADCLVAPRPNPALHPVQVGAFLVFLDMATALFLAWNYRYLLRVPFIGALFTWIEEHGRKTVEKRTWIRRLAFFGVTLYAAGPFEGTGAIGGTIVGRTIGLDAKRTWVAVVSGSIIRTTLITLVLVLGIEVLAEAEARGLTVPLAIGVALLAAAGAGIYLRHRRRKRAPEAKPAAGEAE